MKKIGLVLSGGGVRAMAFHLGVLRFLAERSALERVAQVSTVSGGSLLMGLLLHHNEMRWPSSNDFERVFSLMRGELCGRSLMRASLGQLARPWNWNDLLSRANLVAKALHHWGIRASLSDLPVVPEWSINGTTSENGRRFRFKRDTVGDWIFGYADGSKFPLAKAMAVSAAFPGGIGPISFRTNSMQWKKRKNWNDTTAEEVKLPFKLLHLYDGGVYDNLGIEPFFDVGKQASKIDDLDIYCSDAGAPLKVGPAAGPLSPWRLKRIMDIMSEQSRALRVRAFLNYLASSRAPRGVYVYIDTNLKGQHEKAWQVSVNFKTNLNKLRPEEFDAISGHGYAVSRAAESKHGYFRKTGN
ncbi:NTE family protein [Variovorax paradoxus]|uniref:patatin-like phospholipase family protein n=1 Tax=Variovorax paradoxus TaxID=34073 RepID=UPI002782EEC2|nr:patatin-like phospholipase family protein [Variovorax paradoxus]MDP9965094.1 NTE family protein [Variovorax paradoxus]